ncbi:MAG: hypothetical protein GY751_05180 [Bacteroidetes bacterium]|nr:hypothetical protein [Bacteroidota bacterium]
MKNYKIQVPRFSLLLVAMAMILGNTFSQTLYFENRGAKLIIKNGATLNINGNFENSHSGTVNNQGNLEVTGHFKNTATFNSATTSKLIFDGDTNGDVTSTGAQWYQVILNKMAGRHISLLDEFKITNQLKFISNNNKVVLGNNYMVLGSAASIVNADDNDYILTNGTGSLKKEGFVAGSSFAFPLGFDASTYNPVVLTAQTGHTTDHFSVRCLEHMLANGNSGSVVDKNAVDVSWEITEDITGSSNVDVLFQWASGDELTGFTRGNCHLMQHNGVSWDAGPLVTATGSDPYTVSRNGITTFSTFAVSIPIDTDGDGYTIADGDCDDNDNTVYPGATELCDGKDNDCDGNVPANEADSDGDNFRICDGDCDDNDNTVYPGATELCDGKDNDCDGNVPANEADSDGDNFRICDGDCNDYDNTIFPGATELCDGKDNDCDGNVPANEADSDGDNFRICDGDCDDNNNTVYPGAPEFCDGVDNDCDGTIDEDIDSDGDGWTTCEGDCDDNDNTVYPGATELCDGKDNDCDGNVSVNEADSDGDNFRICEGDCDDNSNTVYPGATEILCDGIDQNCNGMADDDQDQDGDLISVCNGDCDDDDPSINFKVGDPCDDLDPCTINDIIDSDCQCAGTFEDSDNDGICDADDQCLEGVTEVVCIGQPYEYTFTSFNDYFIYGGNTYTLDSILIKSVQGLPAGLTYSCNPPDCMFRFQDGEYMKIAGTPSTSNAPGFYTHTISASVYLLGGTSLNLTFPNPDIFPGLCQIALEGPNSPLCGYVTYDCPASQDNIGDPCEDGNPNTSGETRQPDCSCAVDIPVYNCPASQDNIGDPCEDGDPNTLGETRQPDCSCAGGTIVYDCPASYDNIGDPCEDGDPNTTGETRQPDCSCAVTIHVYDCFTLQANIGDPCEDGNPNTVGETILTNCGCGGGTYLYWCPGTQDNIGDPCEDGDPNTTGETRQPDCSCAVTTPVYDCPTIQANIGDPCNDGNPNTSGDIIQNDCSCQGTTQSCINLSQIDFNIDCALDYNPVCGCDGTTYVNACVAENWFGVTSWTPGNCTDQTWDCPNLQANIGQTCDDGNPLTSGETVQPDCSCAGGTIVYDCPTIQANTGAPCNDGNPNTSGDIIQNDCTCQGTTQSCINLSQIDFNIDCTLDYNPVCGCDGTTYANSCIAENWFGVTTWTPGNCVDQTWDCPNLQANIGQSCDDGNPGTTGDTVQDDCTCQGSPTACINPDLIDFSVNCTTDYNPVCGCNGTTYANVCIAENWFGVTNWTAGGCSINQGLAIPKMFVFDARLKDRLVRINWGINYDPEVEYFLVERVMENGVFKSIGRKESFGENYRPHRYEFDDRSPSQGKNVYRVVIVKTNGSVEFSDEKVVEFPFDLEEFTLFPNPATNEVFISLKKYTGLKAHIQQYNFHGQLTQELRISELPDTPIRLNLNGMTNGLYTITVQIEGKPRISKKLVLNRMY